MTTPPAPRLWNTRNQGATSRPHEAMKAQAVRAKVLQRRRFASGALTPSVGREGVAAGSPLLKRVCGIDGAAVER